ncbi:MAG: tetratricopeptide repeat protein, partial [Rhodothermales bacterium]
MRLVRLLFLLSLVWGTCRVMPCLAQEALPMFLSSEESARLFEQGRQQIFDFRLYEAERIFRRLAQQPDGTVAAGYHLATISFLKALVTDERVYFDELFVRADTLRKHLKKGPVSRWRLYVQAEMQLMRAVAAAKTERFFTSALAGRSAFKQYEKVIAAEPTFYEPYKGMGLMHLMIGSLPGTYRKVLKLLGYGGTVQQGLGELRVAAHQCQLDRETAMVVLAMADVMLNNSASGGVETLSQLRREYPESPLFAYLYGFVLLSNRRAVEAEQSLRRAVQAGTTASYFFIDYAEFYLAQALFRQNKFSEAERYYRHYLEKHRGEALKALAYLETGLILEMQGRRDEALPFYEKVQGDRPYDSDASAYRAAQQRLAAPLTSQERQLLLGRNAYDAGIYDVAEKLLLAVFEGPDAGVPTRAEAAYRLGRVYQALGRLDEALQMHEYVVVHPVDDIGTRWAPWSRFYMGEIFTQHG